MTDIVCQCIYKTFVESSTSLYSTMIDLLLSVIIGASGISINYAFLKKLREEKRKTPLGRKGNVIEPIMRWFCFLQIFYWPYHLAYFWVNFNEIIPSENMNGWWCNVLTLSVELGRIYIAFNSLFIALIRYIYIVHHQKSNQWEFQKVGKLFGISSIAGPVFFEIVRTFVNDHKPYRNQDGFEECISDNLDFNKTNQTQIPQPYPLAWTIQYFPDSVVAITRDICLIILMVVMSNIAEFFLYFQIYRNIQRYDIYLIFEKVGIHLIYI